jgi:hypothetical protein
MRINPRLKARFNACRGLYLAFVGILIFASPVHDVRAGTLEYDYNAETDLTGDDVWKDEKETSPARDMTFVGASTAEPVDVTASGTTISKAYDFGGGETTDPDRTTATTYDGSAVDPGTNGPVAFEFWIKPDATTGNQLIFETGGNTRGANVRLEGSTLYFTTKGASSGDTGAGQVSASYDLVATPTDFIQVVGVVDKTVGGSSTQTRLYVNGQFKDAIATAGRWDLGSDNAGLARTNGAIGGLTSEQETTFGASSSFVGEIGRVRFYSGDTTARDVYNQFIELAPTQADDYADAVLADAPVAYWRLNEPDTTTFAANLGSLGAAVMGTKTQSGDGAIASTAGLITGGDEALDFSPNTGGSFISIPSNGGINTSGPYTNKTIELWFNADTVPTGSTAADAAILFEQGGTSNGANIHLSEGKLVVGRWGNGSNDWAATPFDITAGQTHHVVATIDTSTDQLIGYLDGVKFAVDTDINALSSHSGLIAIGAVDNDTKTILGNVDGSDLNHFDGKIDEVANYNSTLSWADVQRHYTAGGGNLGITNTVEGGQPTLAITLNYDASFDDATNPWEETIGTRDTGENLNSLDWNSTGLTFVADAESSHPGITSAFRSGTGASFQDTTIPAAGNDSFHEKLGNAVTQSDASFEIWFKPTDLDGNEMLFETGGGTDGMGIFLEGSTVNIGARDGSSVSIGTVFLSTYDLADISYDPTTGDFIQAVGVIDVVNNETKLYINGNLLGEFTTVAEGSGDPGTLGDWDGGDAAGLGRRNGSSGVDDVVTGDFSAFEGDIAIFRFYERALTGDEVIQNYYSVSGILVPEPSTLCLAAVGLLGLIGFGRRRKR